ncbi:MAG: DUF3617 domain-containing protein, partial [Betaproteobacteria bacterium]|nr:DUF3617 domain-containing protein [Betaproteobacteria bacterium]
MQAASRLASALAGVVLASLVHAQGPDELWDMTTRMEMAGMQMPATSQQICMKKGEQRAEDLQQDKNCKVTEQKVVGNKMTWTIVCTGKDAMSGTGEMTRTADSMDGRMRMKTSDGDEMNIVYTGKRAGGCNAQTHQDPRMAAAQKQAAAMQAQSNAQIEQMCKEGVDKFNTTLFEMQGSPCLNRKGEYCAHVKRTNESMRTPASYRTAMQKEGMRNQGWERAVQLCSVQTAPTLAAACKSGVSGRDWPFVADYCPAETQQLAVQHCAGREYTAAMSSEYKAICAKHAGGFAQPQRAAAKPAAA